MSTILAVPRRVTVRPPGWAVLAVAVAALAVRIPLYAQISGDYSAFVGPWYDYIASRGGFAALRDNFANYSPPYLYLLAATTYLPVPKLIAIKSISVIFDFLLGYFGYRVVALKYSGWRPPLLAAAALTLAPTVVVNSADWGQCDSIYAAFCLGSMYYLLHDKPFWAAALFGMALSFKLQAVFFLPVVAIILLVRRPARRQLFGAAALVPLVFAAMMVPALAAGAPVSDILSVYPDQIASAGSGSTGSGAGSGNPGLGGDGSNANAVSSYTFNAPSAYQWVPAGASAGWKYLGLAATSTAILALGALAWARRRRLTDTSLLLLATSTVIAIPFLLPGMHERYFYLADAFSICTCFWRPSLWPVAVVVQACSLLAYGPFLWHVTLVPLPVVAVGELAALAASVVFLVQESSRRRARAVPTP